MIDSTDNSPDSKPALTKRAPLSVKYLLRAFAGAIAILLAITIAVPLVVVAIAGDRTGSAIVPRYANTLKRLQAAETMRRFMIPPDSSISPTRAGEALVSLGSREGARIDPLTRRAARGPYSLPVPDPTLFPDARPVGWVGPSSNKVLLASQRGFTREEMDYLASLAANPVWEEHAIVARAPRMDLAAAYFAMPFASEVSVMELPITKFAATKEIAYANVSRAAWFLANQHADSAELAIRETISNGFRLIDDGNMLIDQLIGAVVVGIGRDALIQLYEVTKNPELDRLHLDESAARGNPATEIDAADWSSWARALADSTLPRGLRYELVTTGNLSACTSVGGLLSGPSKDFEAAVATARKQLVRTQSESDIFDLSEQVVTRPSRMTNGGDDPGIMGTFAIWSAHVPAWILRNPRLVNCTGLLISSSST